MAKGFFLTSWPAIKTIGRPGPREACLADSRQYPPYRALQGTKLSMWPCEHSVLTGEKPKHVVRSHGIARDAWFTGCCSWGNRHGVASVSQGEDRVASLCSIGRRSLSMSGGGRHPVTIALPFLWQWQWQLAVKARYRDENRGKLSKVPRVLAIYS